MNIYEEKYTLKMQRAIRFATEVHEVNQKQKRKGKDEAYIAHPLTVGLILSQATNNENVIVAGILHDAVEDCHPDHPVTLDEIKKEFGVEVKNLVKVVTEENPDDPYDVRKKVALDHVREMTNDQILVKSADVIANMTELIHDFEENGESVFERFNTDKLKKLTVQLRMMQALTKRWSENPLAADLQHIAWKTYDMGGIAIRQAFSVEHDSKTTQGDMVKCPLCLWEGNPEMESDSACVQYLCRFCGDALRVVGFASAKN